MPDLLKWAGLICLALMVFAIAIMVVGYKPPSFGRVATVVLLAGASAGCFFANHRKAQRNS